MFFAFNWAFENKGASGFVNFSSDRGKPELTSSPTPKPYRDVAIGPDKQSPFRPQDHHDIETEADISSPSHLTSFRNRGSEARTRIRPKAQNTTRSTSTQTMASTSTAVRSGDRSIPFPYDADRRVKAFEDRVTGLDEQLSLMQKMVNDTLKGRRDLEQEIQTASDAALQLKNSREEWQAKSSALDSQLIKAKAENAKLDSQLVKATADYSVVDAQLDKARGEIAILEDSLTKARADYAVLESQLRKSRSDNSILDSQLSRAQSDISRLEDQLTKVRTEYTVLEKQLESVRLDNAALNVQLTQSVAEKSVLDGQINKLRADWENVENQLSRTRADHSALDRQLIKTRADYTILDGELNSVRVDNSTLSNQLENTRSEHKELSSQINKTRSANAALDDQLTQLRNNCSGLDGQLANARTEITVLDKQLSEARAEVGKILSDHQQENRALEEEFRKEWGSKTSGLQIQLSEANKRIRELEEDLSKASIQGDLNSKMAQYQEELQKERTRIQEVLNIYIKDKSALNDEYHQLMSRTTELQEKLGRAVDEARNEIRSYLEKTTANDEDMKSRASTHLEELKDALKSNLELWNEHIHQKAALGDLLEKERERVQKFHEEKQEHLLKDHQEEKRVLEARYESLKENWQQEKDRMQDEKRALESRLDRLKSENENTQNEKSKLHQERHTLESQHEHFKQNAQRASEKLNQEKHALESQHEHFKLNAQRESEKLQGDIRLLEEKIVRLQETSQQERDRLQNEVRLVDDKYGSLSEQARKEKDRLHDEKRLLEDERRRLMNDKEIAERERQRLSNEQLELQGKYDRLKTEKSNVEEESVKIRNALEAKCANIQTEKEGMGSEIESLRSEKRVIGDEYRNLKEEHETTKVETKRLGDECLAKDGELKRHQAREDELTSQLETVETQLGTTREQLDSNELEIMNLKTEIGRLQAEVKNFEEIMKSSEKAKDEAIQTRSTELAMNLEEGKEVLRKEQQRRHNLEETVAELQRVKETQSLELAGLKQKLEEAEREAKDQLIARETEARSKDVEIGEWAQKFHSMEDDAQKATRMKISAEKKEKEAHLDMEQMKKKLFIEETRRRELFEQIQEFRGNIRVMCRIRPAQQGDGKMLEFKTKPGQLHNNPAGLELVKHTESISRKPVTHSSEFEFERVFTPEESNEAVFYEISQLVQSFMDGKRVCLFCYGQTGTGKTYTMSNEENGGYYETGVHSETDGIVPRTKTMTFREVQRLRDLGRWVEVKACCYEIYMDKLYLLTKRSGSGRAEKSFNANSNNEDWSVRDPEFRTLESAEDFDQMYDQAMASRQFRPTKMNDQSSRSHFIVRLEFTSRLPHSAESYSGMLNLVDLAGSERRKTSGTAGDGLAEGIAINESLSVLKSVLLRLKEGEKPMEYRQKGGTLARLLQPSLGVNSTGSKCMTLMFVMINLRESDYDISRGSLEYAMTAQKVVTTAPAPAKPPADKKKRVSGATAKSST